MKLTKQKLKQLIKEEHDKLRESDDPLASPGLNKRMDHLRRVGANTRGTVQDLNQARPSVRGDSPADIALAVKDTLVSHNIELTDEDAVEQVVYRKLDEFGIHKDDWADWEAEIYANLDPLANEGCGDERAELSGKNFPKLPGEDLGDDREKQRENKVKLSKIDLRRIVKEEINDMIANPTSKEPEVAKLPPEVQAELEAPAAVPEPGLAEQRRRRRK